jgi:hypothetical protein
VLTVDLFEEQQGEPAAPLSGAAFEPVAL